jgi:hypothetical protein
MPEALASRRGAALNWRFAVNGIQKLSRLGALVLLSIKTSYFESRRPCIIEGNKSFSSEI